MDFFGDIKRTERHWFVVLIIASAVSLAATLYTVWTKSPDANKFANTFGILLTLTGLLQLEISGVFERLSEIFSNDEKYPSGPPSYFYRETMVHEDDGLFIKLKNICFFKPKTGFWLVVVGTTVQLIAVWI